MVMKKVFGKTITTPSWQEAQKLADAKQAKQEAKAQEAKADADKVIKILGIAPNAFKPNASPTHFKAYLDNGKTAKFDAIDLAKFEHLDIVNKSIADDTLTAELLGTLSKSPATIAGSECVKILESHNVSEGDFVKFLVDHTTDHA